MKRDFGLVRDILLAIESSDNNPNETIDDLQIEGHPKEEISYHVNLLHEARFIDALELSYADEYAWRPKRLTWNGCEFLDDIRDPVVWEKLKQALRPLVHAVLHSSGILPKRLSEVKLESAPA